MFQLTDLNIYIKIVYRPMKVGLFYTIKQQEKPIENEQIWITDRPKSYSEYLLLLKVMDKLYRLTSGLALINIYVNSHRLYNKLKGTVNYDCIQLQSYNRQIKSIVQQLGQLFIFLL